MLKPGEHQRQLAAEQDAQERESLKRYAIVERYMKIVEEAYLDSLSRRLKQFKAWGV